MSAAAGVAEESSTGCLRPAPLAAHPALGCDGGRSFADVALVAWGIFVTAGRRVRGLAAFGSTAGIGGSSIGFVLMLVSGYAFTWVFITIGLVSGNAQAAQGLSMLVIPFSFISSANVPVQSMPGWMQPFAANQPVSVVINAVRCLMQGGPEVVGGGIGHSTAYWVVLSLIWSAAILVVFSFLATRRFSRTI
jgi:ABC-2 type transport system permease protein